MSLLTDLTELLRDYTALLEAINLDGDEDLVSLSDVVQDIERVLDDNDDHKRK